MSRLFLLAYACSGMAGLIYEVTWTRVLTLYIGHTTGAAAAVVAAFLGGLAIGAGGGGRVAARLSPGQGLRTYIGLEIAVALMALALPYELAALTPLLQWAYRDGAGGLLFPAVRLLICLLLVFVPSTALGATFPMAIRWFAGDAQTAARRTSALYLVNTIGAAAGAILAGFVLIPALGISGTTLVGVGAGGVAALSVLAVLRAGERFDARDSAEPRHRSRRAKADAPAASHALAIVVLGLSGFAALVHEIAWTRILTLVLGPTTYAFAATVAAVITGIAIGSGVGAWLIGRTSRPAAWLALTFGVAAIASTVTYTMAGRQIPSLAAQQFARSSNAFGDTLLQGVVLTAALILPTAMCLGAAFPLALAIARDPAESAARRFSLVYAINTVGAVSGSLAAGFLLIPALGLRPTLIIVSGCLIAAALAVLTWGHVSGRARAGGWATAIAATAAIVLGPRWDRDLLASGIYLYAEAAPKDVDLNTLLKAGTLLYYREGAASTVSVKRLTGTTTLAVDGKVDASNRGDMLTQKLIAHLPLLLHEQPRAVGILGLGSGVTLGAALAHPIERADVIEISPDVVEASRFFDNVNGRGLSDPRTRLLVGDGRSHFLLSSQSYDVVISEPSNPWIAGVAALFTQEFFAAARERLAPGGIMCQWANAYNISDRDLRSIVATFKSVFPEGTIWLVGRDDVLMVGAREPLEKRIAMLDRHWGRGGASQDLAQVAVLDPFSISSLLIGGPLEMARYAEGAPLITDDRMTLEFTAPRELHQRRSGENTAALRALAGGNGEKDPRAARLQASAAEWTHRGAMFAKADVHGLAYEDFVRALEIEPSFAPALDGLVRAATLTRSASDASGLVKSLTDTRAPTVDVLVARSKLLAAAGLSADAQAMAGEARTLAPASPGAMEQQASLLADAGNVGELETLVAALHAAAPNAPATFYYDAVLALLQGRTADAAAIAERAIAADASYAPVYDLIGAAYTKLDRLDAARDAFLKSLTFDAHDSSAYINLGLVELAAGNRDLARNYFAEALWLEPDSRIAREGLARAMR